MRWYERAMPTVGDAKPYIQNVAKELAALKGVKNVYAWGSFAENINTPKYSVKDIDLLVACNFDSGDLLAIDKSPFGAFETPEDELEEQGFDRKAVAFTKTYLKYSQYNIDQWVLSSDYKLLHWGPLTESVEEWKTLRADAESNAKKATGLTRKQLCKSSEEQRQQWKDAYDRVMQDFISGDPSSSGDPTGWYSADPVVFDVLEKAIRLA